MGGHRAENDKRLRSACNSNNTRVRKTTSDDSLLFVVADVGREFSFDKMFLISQLISFLNIFQKGREGVGLYNK